MPARDTYHDAVRHALEKDGWTITDDPLRLQWGRKDLYVDLGLERFLGAEKGTRRIAVEIKSFIGASEMRDLEGALGQHVLYSDIMSQTELQRELYLAIREGTWQEVFEEPIGKLLLDKKRFRLLVFDPHEEVILRWIPEPLTANSS